MRKLLFAVMLFVMGAVFTGCGGGGSGETGSVQPAVSYAGTYIGTIASSSSRAFTVIVDAQNNVSGTYANGLNTYTIQGTVSGKSLTAMGSNGDVWGGEINNGILVVVVAGRVGNASGLGSLQAASSNKFTNSMLAGHVVSVPLANGTRSYSFALTGNTVQWNTLNGTWTVNPNGGLTVTLPTDNMTFTPSAVVGNTITATYVDAATPTVLRGPIALTIM